MTTPPAPSMAAPLLAPAPLRAKVREALMNLHDMTGVGDDDELQKALQLDSLDLFELESELGYSLDVEIDVQAELESGRLDPLTVTGLAAWLAVQTAPINRTPIPVNPTDKLQEE